MSTEKMREEFEATWGFTNAEQECYFLPELNCYGSARVNRAAESKSTAWAYFQKGWKASHEALAIDLPKPLPSGDYRMTVPFYKAADIIEALSAEGIEVKA